MNKTITAKDAGNIHSIRKEAEYKTFIDMVGKGTIPDTWELTAEALGVHRKTIENWKKLPEFKEAKQKGIDYCLREMRRSGKDDWRQWEASLKLLGVKSNDGVGTTVNVSVPIFNVATTEAKEKLEQLYAGSNSANN